LGAGAESVLALHCTVPGIETAVWKTPLESIAAALLPYPTNTLAPATLAVGTLPSRFSVCDCAERTPVRYACIVDAETATSCPLAFTCASTHTTASSAVAAGKGGVAGARSKRVAPTTRLEGACANTKMLCVVPMSCVRGWIVAVTFAVVDVMLELT